ncbi:hypothetical protein BH09BAC1_BH09BAC1_06810 [soil metagenome]
MAISIFFNNDWDTIIIQSLATVGDSWRFYSKSPSVYIDAQITNIDTATVLGNIDSVKVLRLTATTGNTSLSQWNGVELQLSKTHGLIVMPQILSFPSNNALVSLTPLKPLTYAEVYNYNIGDYFQIRQEYTTFGGIAVTLTLKVVLDKVIFNGGKSVTYTFHREEQSAFNGNTPALTTDTIITTYHDLDKYIGSALPNNVEETGDTMFPLVQPHMAIYSGNEVALQGKRTTKLWEYILYEQISDTCWLWDGIVYEGNDPPYYFECVGPLFQNSSGFNGMTQETLVYYNLCGQQSGTKLILGVKELPETQVSIHPNPAADVVEINNTSNTHYNINLVNLHGQVLQTFASQPTAVTPLDVSQLPLGLYIVQLSDGIRTYYKKIVVAR